jgi:HAD superfamily hydrolase (TIGR01509 family)
MIRAAIFDVDGTLVDTVDFHAEAWQRAFQHFGKEVAFADVRAQIGKGGDQLMPVFLSKEEIEERGEEISKWRTELFAKEYMPRVQGFPKVRELFQELLANGLRIALASSAIGKELQTYEDRAEIADLIDTETSKDDAEKSKPHPDIFEAALDRLGNLPPEQAIVIGDTPYDIEAAAKAGLQTIAVRCGGFPEETLQGAVAIYDDPADLLARLAGSPLISSSRT